MKLLKDYRLWILVSLCFYVCISSVSSQRIFSQGHYDYSFNGDLVYGVSEIDYDSKYSIGSDSIYVFSRKRNNLFFDSEEIEEFLLDTMFIIGSDPDSITVRYGSDSDTHLVYDFNLEVGSVYTVYPDGLPESDSMEVTILGYGDTLLSGQLVPYQTLQYTNYHRGYVFVDKVYKGIGSLLFYFDIFDIFKNFIGGGLGGPLVCYNNQDIDYINENLSSEFINEISGQCLPISNNIDILQDYNIKIFPNPAKDYLKVTFNGDEVLNDTNGVLVPDHVSLYSIDGRIISDSWDKSNSMLHIPPYVKTGIYTVVILSLQWI